MSNANDAGDDRVELPGGTDRSIGRHRYFESSDGDGPAWLIYDHAPDRPRLIPACRLSVDGPVRFGGHGLIFTAAAIRYEPYPEGDAVSGYGLHMAGWAGAATGVYTRGDAPGVRVEYAAGSDGWQWADGTGSYEVDNLADVAARVRAIGGSE